MCPITTAQCLRFVNTYLLRSHLRTQSLTNLHWWTEWVPNPMNSNGLSCCLGYGQEKGGISCILYNRHPEKDLVVVVMVDGIPGSCASISTLSASSRSSATTWRKTWNGRKTQCSWYKVPPVLTSRLKVHLHWVKPNATATFFLWSLWLFNVNLKFDSLSTHLEARI